MLKLLNKNQNDPWMDGVIALENPACTLSPMEEGKMMEQKTEY